MSNQRETIISAVVTLLDGISSSGGYNTTPTVCRRREHFENFINLPAIYVEETEPEAISQAAFRMMQGSMTIGITGAIRSTGNTSINSLMEDVRVRLESTANAYRDYVTLESIQAMTEPESDKRYFEAIARAIYFYEVSSA